MALGRLLPLAAMIGLGGYAQAQEVVEDGQINYLTGDPATWPSELEATVAAPDNHRILLENEHVRVLEVTLGPGEVEPLHFHRWPSVLHILQADQWIDRDADGKVIFDSREVPPIQYPLTMWKGPEAPHSPVNLSDSVPIRLIRVEVKQVQTMSAQPDAMVDFSERYAAAWSSQKPEAVAAFYAEDGQLVANGGEPAVGRAAIADVARGFMEAFPDMVVAFDRLGVSGERRTFHWTLTGTNTGHGGTGARVQISGVEAWLVGDDGLIADSDGSFDADDYARQLALTEPDTGADPSSGSGLANEEPANREIQQTIDTVYAAISGPAGVPRDWDAFRSVFSDDARLFTITPGGLQGGSVDEYVARSSDALVAYGFTEEELVNRIENYGNLAQVWSSYEGDFVREGQPGQIRGINSFQLQREADGSWRVHSLLWQQETPEFPLPVDMSDASDRQIKSVSQSFPAAETEIRTAIAYWVETYNRNDWTALAEQFTKDAVMMPPNSPAVAGRAAIAAWEKANEDGFRIALRPDEISVAGGQAVIRGRSCVFIPLDNGRTGVDIGKFLEVRHRQPDGRWLVSQDIFNSDIPAGGDVADSCPDEIMHAGPRHPNNAAAPALPDLTPILDSRTRVILDGIRSGDVSGIMALYGVDSLYSTDNATLLSDPEAIEAFWVNVAASPAHDATLKVLRIERLGPDAFVEIQKYDVFDQAGVRMFGGYASLLWRRVEGRWIIAADVSN